MKKILLLFGLISLHLMMQGQWNPNTSVNLEVATVPIMDMQSLTTSTGKTWVAFYHNNNGNYDMRAQLLDVDGNKLLGPDGMLVDNKPSGSATYVFNICKDANDNLVVAYQDQRNGNLSAVVYKVSPAGTHVWNSNGVVLGEGLAPNPTTLTTGETVIGWIESVSNTMNIQKISAAGTTVWSSPIVVQVGTSKTTRGQLITNLNGKFTMVFQKRGFGITTTLYAQRFNADGTSPWAAPVQISTETTSGARYYSISSEADTTYFGYYSSVGSRFNSWLQRINPDGSIPYGTNGSNFSTATGGSDPYQQTTNMVQDPGSPYVWSVCSYSNTNQNQYGVYVQKFLKSTGARLFSDNALNIYPISGSFDTQAGNVSLVNDAPVFMSYDVNYKIYATRLDGNGAFVWTPNRIELSSTTAGGSTPKGRFGFTSLSNTQAVAIWAETRNGVEKAYAQNITPGGLFGLDVTTQGNVPATITTSGGTLQLVATIAPASANQAVTWSIAPGTGTASISTGGLVTATGNGTVWAKAISVQDNTVKDSLQLTISGQGPIVPVSSLAVTTQGNVPATINTNGGTLQMVATFSPANASNQNVTWSIVPVTGNASISSNGLVTAIANGTVYAKAISVANAAAKDSVLITLSNQTVPVTGLVVTTQGNVPATITNNGGSLQLVATIAPANASNQNITWSVIPVSGTASIGTNGLVTAITNGTVYAKAVSVANPNAKDSILITISNQIVAVTGLTVSTQGNVPATITTNAGTLQMVATIIPANATNQNVTWSIVPGTGTASISATGLVTATTNGTVFAKAISVANPAAKDSVQITITNQIVVVTGIVVSTQGSVPATITTNGGTLQMIATISPANATNQNVTWSIVPGTGTASISATGLVTAISNGTVHAKAVSDANNSLKDSLQVTITNQVVTAVVNPTLRTLSIYPNPAHDQITLKLLKNHPAMQLQIVNATGQVVYEEALGANRLRNLYSIRLDRLSGGFYYVKLLEGRNESVFTFLKQ
ncbi:MAG: Ig-like domain-containing protein [Bacteroidota bacterium]